MITSSDVEHVLNPEANAKKFLAARVSSTIWTEIINSVKAKVYSHLPLNYAENMTKICGTWLTHEAVGGELTFSVPTVAQSAVDATSAVWVNYAGVYHDRKRSDRVTATFSATTITLATALSEGDYAIADISHSFANPPQLLKSLAVELAVDEVCFRLRELVDPKDRADNTERITRTWDQLRDIRQNKIVIEEWSALDQVREYEPITRPGEGILIPAW